MSIVLVLVLLSQAEIENKSSADWYAARVEEERPKQIKRLSDSLAKDKRRLAFAKKGRIVRGLTSIATQGDTFEFPNAEVKRHEIARMEETIEKTTKRIAALKDKTEDPNVFIDPLNIQIGHVGKIGQAVTVQVVGGNAALVNLIWVGPSKAPAISPGGRLLGGLGQSNDGEVLVWFELDSTQGITDGKEHDFKGLFEVTGTKVYQSRSGPRSVFVLRPFEMPKPVTAPPRSDCP